MCSTPSASCSARCRCVKLLLAQDDVKVETLMNQQFVCVHTTDDQELVADTVRKYDLISIPVVDHEERMIGIITIDDIVRRHRRGEHRGL